MISTGHSFNRLVCQHLNLSKTQKILQRIDKGHYRVLVSCISSSGSHHQWQRSERSNKGHSKKNWAASAFPFITAGLALAGCISYYKIQTNHAVSRPSPKEVEDEILENESIKSCTEEKVKHERRSNEDRELDLQATIAVSKDLCQRIKDETGSPGLSVAVFVNGREKWSDGFGFSDLENRVHCGPDSVMRIASISKSIAMAIVAKLMEENKLDLDKDVREYVPEWPEKTYNGEKVTITTRQLVSHLSGIRHYDKDCGKKKKEKKSEGKDGNDKTGSGSSKKTDSNASDSVYKEFYSKHEYGGVISALEIFKNDNLCSKPGTEFLYTTHGWTLISAVAERVAGKKFSALVKNLFHDLGMDNSYLDEHKPIIYNRARQYMKNRDGRIINAPFVDCSNKWAGGGMLSSARDVARFGNAMLYSYQRKTEDTTLRPGYLQPDTMDQLWSPVDRSKCLWSRDMKYGMGWAVAPPGVSVQLGGGRDIREYYSHTGAAVGGASVLIVMPSANGKKELLPPKGVVVAMIANTSSVSLSKTAIKIAKIFEALEDA